MDVALYLKESLECHIHGFPRPVRHLAGDPYGRNVSIGAVIARRWSIVVVRPGGRGRAPALRRALARKPEEIGDGLSCVRRFRARGRRGPRIRRSLQRADQRRQMSRQLRSAFSPIRCGIHPSTVSHSSGLAWPDRRAAQARAVLDYEDGGERAVAAWREAPRFVRSKNFIFPERASSSAVQSASSIAPIWSGAKTCGEAVTYARSGPSRYQLPGRQSSRTLCRVPAKVVDAPGAGALFSRSPPTRGQYGRSGCVWLYAVIACSGTLLSLASSNPAPSAQLLTSAVLACHREPVISARDSRARAIRMASPTSSAARRVRFMARWSNTARESSSAGRPGRSRSSVRTVSASSSRLKTPAGLSNRPTGGRDGT